MLLAVLLAGCGARGGPWTAPPASAGPSPTGAPRPSTSGPPSGVLPSASAVVSPPRAVAPSPSVIPTSGTTGDAAVTLLAAGDIGRCDATTDDATGALVASLDKVVATLGDTAYEDGTAQELTECFGGAWGAVKDRIRFAVTGNHDIHTDNGKPLQDYLGTAAVRDGRTWFSDTLGAWHVIVLDGNCGLTGSRCAHDSEQARWLRDDLAATTARCTVALMHQPRFSSGQHGDDRHVRPLWDALYAANAELVLDGHDHDYERFAPQDPDGTPDGTRGIVEIVAGMGGATLEAFRTTSTNSLVRINVAYGVLELTFGADAWSSRFIDTDGAVRDSAGGTCH